MSCSQRRSSLGAVTSGARVSAPPYSSWISASWEAGSCSGSPPARISAELARLSGAEGRIPSDATFAGAPTRRAAQDTAHIAHGTAARAPFPPAENALFGSIFDFLKNTPRADLSGFEVPRGA